MNGRTMGANERKNVMYVRKKRQKWQCLVRLKGVSVSQSFFSKSDARLWGQKTEVDISNGVYLKNLKLIEMRLKDLLHLYLEKARAWLIEKFILCFCKLFFC